MCYAKVLHIECSLAELNVRRSAVYFSLSLSLFFFLSYRATYACTPAIGAKLAELSIRGTYAIDLIREKRRSYFQAVLYYKIALFVTLDCEFENMFHCQIYFLLRNISRNLQLHISPSRKLMLKNYNKSQLNYN